MKSKPSKGPGFILAGIALAGALGAFWLWSLASQDDPLDSFGAGSEVAGAEIGDRARMESAATGEQVRAAAASSAVGVVDPAAATAKASSAGAADFEVLVVEHGTKKPIAAAEITYATFPEPASASDHPWRWLREGELEAHLPADALHLETDAEGRVRVEKPAEIGLVIAKSGELWGWIPLQKQHVPPLTLELVRDADVRVRVTDASGQPSGNVRVSLRMRQQEWFSDRAFATTADADGIAVLRHVGFQVRAQQGWQPRFYAGLFAILDKPVEIELDPDALPTDTLELVLPPTGEVEVRVVDLDGELTQSEVEVELRIARPEELETPVAQLEQRAAAQIPDVRDGIAVFRHVAPGVPLIARVTRSNSQQAHVARGKAPAAGNRATISVRLGEQSAVVTGRVVDESGQPRAKKDLSAVVKVDNLREEQLERVWSFRSDEQGRFTVDLKPRTGEEGVSTLMLLERGDNGGLEGSGSVPLPAVLSTGVHDFGDFVLRPAPTLVTGTVLGSDGTPVAGAWIQVSYKRTFDGRDDFWWQHVWDLRASSGAGGRFELRGSTSHAELSLQAGKEGARGIPVIVSIPAADVVLRMSATGEIAGQLLVDEALSGRDMMVMLQRRSLDSERGQDMNAWSNATPNKRGEFTASDLGPGTYDITISTVGTWTQLMRIEDVVVEAGQTTRDPRLNPIDLRGTLHALELRIVDEDGRPIGNGYVVSKATGSESEHGEGTSWSQITEGNVLLTSPASEVDLTIFAQGYCLARLERVSSNREIVLKRAPVVRLVLPSGTRLPEPPYELTASLNAVDSEFGSSWWDDPPKFDAQRRIELNAPATGRVRVDLQVRLRRDNGSTTMSSVSGEVEQILDVRESPSLQTFEIALDEAKLAEAIRQMDSVDDD